MPRLFPGLSPAACAALILVAGLLTGCGAGQLSQTSMDKNPVNGSNAEAGDIALRNVYLAAESVGERIGDYGSVSLSFTAIHTGIGAPDRLLAIASAAAEEVRIEAEPDELVIDAGTAIAAGQPIESVDPATAPDEPFTVVVRPVAGALRPGVALPFTFVFERGGEVTFGVPFDVWSKGEPPSPTRPQR
ncbi:copper chaperone PCu(A)C [Nocardia otitidiscaviarum]|uniref:hypothetical protein n=1 Tax=Nocardia otitidiscaviarum TaxID=1823 RepID=UPI0018936649|nr:hypothetical protein [Nocardia otitidiscaviarum]MBF6181694.1 hypothetical protein [Nocardia otitidiscaviarum]